MKKVIALALAAAVCVSLGACAQTTAPSASGASGQSQTSTASGADGKQLYIAMFPKGYVGDFWKEVEQGAMDAAKDYNVKVTFEGPESETDLDGQTKLIENAINKGADVIAIAPLDSVGNVPVIEKVQEAGIKCITFNSSVQSDIPLTLVSTDNLQGGQIGGKALGEAMGGEGKYAIVGSNEAVDIARDRCNGAADYIKKNYPGMQLISIQYTNGDLNKALEVASDFIAANPDIKGFFSNNETTTIAVATVLQEKGLSGKIKHVGFDATKQTAGYLTSGTTQAIVTQMPYKMGYMTVEKAIAAYKGEKLDKNYDTGVTLVTPQNVNSAEMQAIINPSAASSAASGAPAAGSSSSGK